MSDAAERIVPFCNNVEFPYSEEEVRYLTRIALVPEVIDFIVTYDANPRSILFAAPEQIKNEDV